VTPAELAAELRRRAAAEQMPPHGQLPQVAQPAPAAASPTGWSPQAVGAYILAPVLALLASWLLRAPAPPPDAPTHADIVQLEQRLDLAQAEVAAARSDCVSARENAVVARSRAAGAEAVADSVARPR
jgi:hypothetical protein